MNLNAWAIGGSWHQGVWDSSIYNRDLHPRTVALRIEVVDSESQIPLQGARITLKGTYLEERVGHTGDDIGKPYEPQERDYEVTATTDEEGIAVFALSWQKIYPWRSYFGDSPPSDTTDFGSRVKESWIRAVDDIEKIEYIEIRHPKYNFKKIPFNFKHLTEFGQEKNNSYQHPELFDKFEAAWIQEMKKKNVKYCILDLGKDFKDFQNIQSTRPEFFNKIKAKDYGTVYTKPYNLFSKGEYPQSECGPYFVYLLDDVEIERRVQEIDVNTNNGAKSTSNSGDFENQLNPDSVQNGNDQPESSDNQKKKSITSNTVTSQSKIEEYKRIAENNSLGIAVNDLTKERAVSLGLSPIVATNFAGSQGVIIEYIVPGSPAYQAGLRKDCIITIIYYIDDHEQHLFNEDDFNKINRDSHLFLSPSFIRLSINR
jgi:hypothetical protein